MKSTSGRDRPFVVVVDDGVRAHLLGTAAWVAKPADVAAWDRRGGRGEVDGIRVGVALLEVGRVVGLGSSVSTGSARLSTARGSGSSARRLVDLERSAIGVSSTGCLERRAGSSPALDGFVAGGSAAEPRRRLRRRRDPVRLDRRATGRGVVGDDRDLAGQFGDGHRVGCCRGGAGVGRRPAARRWCRSSPAARRPRWAACWCCRRRICHRLLPLALAKPADVSTKAVPSASLSSFRKINPSRNAQGQMSTVSIARALILASATNAPATICGARSALTPSSSARSAVVILEMKAMS